MNGVTLSCELWSRSVSSDYGLCRVLGHIFQQTLPNCCFSWIASQPCPRSVATWWISVGSETGTDWQTACCKVIILRKLHFSRGKHFPLNFSLLSGHPVNQVDSNGFTSLQVCAALGWTSALSVLLKYGADIHARSPLGWTALMQAVRNGHSDTTEVLLEAGANVSDKNSLGNQWIWLMN